MKKQEFWIRLADLPVWLAPVYPYMKKYCENYAIDPTAEDRADYFAWRERLGADPDSPVAVTPEEIAAERDPESGIDFPAPYLETLALYRKLCDGLLSEDRLLFHCSALALDGEGYLFTAPSGTGKSTHARLWRERFGSRVQMVNDDKPLLRFFSGGEIRVYGTPYGGKENLQRNTSAPVRGIVVLRQAPGNTIRRLSAREAFPYLLSQCYYAGKNPEAVVRALDLTGRLAALPVFLLGCTVSQEAVELSFRSLRDEGIMAKRCLENSPEAGKCEND